MNKAERNKRKQAMQSINNALPALPPVEKLTATHEIAAPVIIAVRDSAVRRAFVRSAYDRQQAERKAKEERSVKSAEIASADVGKQSELSIFALPKSGRFSSKESNTCKVEKKSMEEN